MKQYLYVRVSTDGQEYLRQFDLLNEKGYNESNSIILTETYSAKTMNRPILQQMLKDLVEGDVVIIESLSRLARSTKDLLVIIETIMNKKASLISLKEQIDMNTPVGKFFISIIGAVNQFERDTTAQRTKESLRAKQRQGVVLGRPTVIKKDLMDRAVDRYMNSNLSYLLVSKEIGISDATICNEIKKRGLTRKRTRIVNR